jgi:hypothetical protein
MAVFIDRERLLVKPFSLGTLATHVEEIIEGAQQKTLGRGNAIASPDDARNVPADADRESRVRRDALVRRGRYDRELSRLSHAPSASAASPVDLVAQSCSLRVRPKRWVT